MPAMFELSPDGLRVRCDPNDNPQGHPSPHSESGLVSVFEIKNVGDEEGECRAGHEVDGSWLSEWSSGPVAPGDGVNAVHPLGRHSAGEHTFLIYVNPGSGQMDHAENTITVD
ncbi:MAG TPA: hypothetical protein VF712_07035 [Thermoleophilaceae bacterium]|jgi:hypothetical protein